MAYGNVDDCELQKRDQLLGDFRSLEVTQKSAWFMDHRIRHGIGERLDLQDGRTRQRSGSR